MEPTSASSITWGILCACFVLMYCTFGIILARWFRRPYASAVGASVLCATLLVTAPIVLTHVARTV
jgi:hypothetical protein